MRRTSSWVAALVICLMYVLSAAAWARPAAAAAAPIMPTPPELVLDKQLPGEDPYWIYRPTFSPDNKYVAAFMSSTKTITIWDTATAKVVKEIPDSVHQMDALDGLEFSNDGKQLLLLRNSQPLRYLDWNAGKMTREVPLNADPKKILDYAFNPSQSLLAVGTYTGVKLYDLRAGKMLKQYCQGVPICGLDMLEYTNRQGKLVRVLAYAKALMPPDQNFKNVAGLINLDSGAVIPLLNDVPADKRIDNKMTFFRVKFEWGGSYLLITAYVIPPSNHAIAYLIDTSNGKYISSEQLGQLVMSYDSFWLGKPFYGFLMSTVDMTQQSYKIATQFLVATRKDGLKVIDTVDESTLAVQSISISRNRNWAAVTVKKDQMDPSHLYLYKLVPKRR